MVEAAKKKKVFKYSRERKLPSCKRPFKTNRSWQDFCPKTKKKDCQQEWHRLLKKKHEDIIIEIEALKEGFAKLNDEFKKLTEEMIKFKEAVGKIKGKGVK